VTGIFLSFAWHLRILKKKIENGTCHAKLIFLIAGDFGKYQMWQFTLHILSAVTAGLHMLSLVTVAAVPEHRYQCASFSLLKMY
jgi:hypothetical protein